MISLDRFAYGPRDPQDVEPVTFCPACGREVYPLDEVYSLDGYLIHAEGTCLADYFHLTPVEARDAWGK